MQSGVHADAAAADAYPGPVTTRPREPAAAPAHRDPRLLVLVAVGGTLGAAARHGVDAAVGPHPWPWSTLAVNVPGAFALALLSGALATRAAPTPTSVRRRLLLGTGFLGAFTTYSSLALDVHGRLRDGAAALAVGYGLTTLVLGLVASLLGLRLGVVLARRRTTA